MPLASNFYFKWSNPLFAIFCFNTYLPNILVSLKTCGMAVHLINIRQSLLSVYIMTY